MKVKYTELHCAVCGKLEQIRPGQYIPYWFRITAEGHTFSTGKPNINCMVCSMECVSKVPEAIKRATDENKKVHPKSEIEMTICDQCGKTVIVDKFNFRFGGDPLFGWTIVQMTSGPVRHLCSKECLAGHTTNPENSIKIPNFKTVSIGVLMKILESIQSSGKDVK